LDLEHGSEQLVNASCHDVFEVGEVIATKHEVLCAFEAITLAQQKLEAGDDVGIDEVLAAARNVGKTLPWKCSKKFVLVG
jgi:hypothetical protein